MRRVVDNGLTAAASNAHPPLNADEFIAWLEENRPPKCKPCAVPMYWALLEYDMQTHESGFDGSYVPGLSFRAIEKVKAWVVARAESNARQ